MQLNLWKVLFGAPNGHVEKGEFRVSESDVYEALAFANATACNLVVLGYPAVPIDAPAPVGTCKVFEKIEVDKVQIIGVQIESRLISKSGAVRRFSDKMAADLSQLFK